MTSSFMCFFAYSSAGASPHHHVASAGKANVSPRSRSESAGKNPWSAPDSRMPLPSAFARSTLPARAAARSPGTPRAESARSSTGSQ